MIIPSLVRKCGFGSRILERLNPVCCVPVLLNEFHTCITNLNWRESSIWLKPVLICAITGFGELNLLNSVTNMSNCRVCFYLRMIAF